MSHTTSKQRPLGLVVMFPPPSPLTNAIHSELKANRAISDMSAQALQRRQRDLGRAFFDKAMAKEEVYVDSNGVEIKRRVMVKTWMEMKSEALAWGEATVGGAKQVM